MSSDPQLSRRAVLLGAMAVVAASCRPRHASGRRGASLPSPDQETLHAALQAELSLVAAYETLAGLSQPAKAQAIDTALAEHRLHVAALTALLPTSTTTPTPASTVGRLTGGALAQAVRTNGRQLQHDALDVADGHVGAVLASVAASHLSPPPVALSGEWYGGKAAGS